MPVASRVTVNITAETAKFESGLKKAKGQSKAFASGVTAAFRGATVVTAALGGALALLTKRSFELVDQQTKTARTIGTTQKVFAGLSLAAEISGLSVESFTKSLKKQQKAIVDANDGLLTQKRAFDRLGLSAEELIKLPVEEQFKKIVTELDKVNNATLKVGIASDIFGSKNSDLINILELGADGLDAYINKVQELGIALTQGQTGAIEEANDAATILKKSFEGLGNQLASQFAPSIKRAAETLTKFVVSISQGVELLAINLRDLLGLQKDLDVLSLDGLRQEYALTQNKIQELNESLLRANETINAPPVGPRGGALIAAAQAAVVKYQKTLEELRAELDRNIEAQKQLLTATVAPATSFDDVESFAPQGVDPEVARLQRLAQEYASFRHSQLATAQALAIAVETPMDTLERRMMELRRQLETNLFTSPEVIAANTQAAVDVYFEQLKSMEDQTKEVFANLNEFQAEAARNAQDIFAEFLFDPFNDGVNGMLKSFVDMLRRMVAQLIAAKLLSSFLSLFPGTAAAGSIVGSSGGGAGVGPPAAIGGNRRGGTPLLVGERGPEMFTPGASGAIRPLGAVSVTTENNFGGGGDLTAATLIPILEENNKRVKAEILDAFDRGSFA